MRTHTATDSRDGVELTVDYFDGSTWISTTKDMFGNGPQYSYSVNLPCNHTFNYSIQVYDAQPNIIIVGNTSLRAYWGPVIIDMGILQNTENSILVWV